MYGPSSMCKSMNDRRVRCWQNHHNKILNSIITEFGGRERERGTCGMGISVGLKMSASTCGFVSGLCGRNRLQLQMFSFEFLSFFFFWNLFTKFFAYSHIDYFEFF